MEEKWIENTMKWFEKKSKRKSKSKKASLQGKFDKLSAEKEMMDNLLK